MDLFQQQMNRKDEHVGHANQQYRATSAPEFVETRFVHHPFTTVDVADVTLQTNLAGHKASRSFARKIQMESSSRTLVRITMLRLLNALLNSSKQTRFKFTSTVRKNS